MFKWCSSVPRKYPLTPLLHHHQQPEPLLQGRMNAIHTLLCQILTLPSKIHRMTSRLIRWGSTFSIFCCSILMSLCKLLSWYWGIWPSGSEFLDFLVLFEYSVLIPGLFNVYISGIHVCFMYSWCTCSSLHLLVTLKCKVAVSASLNCPSAHIQWVPPIVLCQTMCFCSCLSCP